MKRTKTAPVAAAGKKAKKDKWVEHLSWSDVTPLTGEDFLTGAEEGGFMQLEEMDGSIFMEAAKAAVSHKAKAEPTEAKGAQDGFLEPPNAQQRKGKKQKGNSQGKKGGEHEGGKTGEAEGGVETAAAKQGPKKTKRKKGSKDLQEESLGSHANGGKAIAVKKGTATGEGAKPAAKGKGLTRKERKRLGELKRREELKKQKLLGKVPQQPVEDAVGVEEPEEEEPGEDVGEEEEAAKPAEEEGPGCDTSAWEAFKLHPKLLQAISALGFENPTEIQQRCLPKALGGKDIVGAAETGSGKTLAFGLPILQKLLSDSDQGSRSSCQKDHRLRALILTPTRELALQVCSHLQAAARFTDLRVVPIVGGIAPQKQQRLLRTHPAIVVGTPGRLWELMSSGEEHLVQVGGLRFFVLDEADRMVEKGHFKELQSIVDMLPATRKPPRGSSSSSSKEVVDEEGLALAEQPESVAISTAPQGPPRQTFVFSATLMVPAALKKKLKSGGRVTAQGKAAGMVGQLIDRAGVSPKAAIIDLTSETLMAHRLEEAAIECLETEKDVYLYYLLKIHAGRTLVFCSAISAVRRIAAVLKLLEVPSWALHASMQQRQRLKAMDHFKAVKDGVLVATDVAARGLDIPGVRTVVHYQLPLSAELYVHRSGRTARAHSDGCSVAIVSPSERHKLNALCKALKKPEGLPDFPVDLDYLPAVQERVKLALRVDKVLRGQQKTNAKKSWLHKNAEAIGVDIEDEDPPGGDDDDRGGSKLKRQKETSGKVNKKRQALELKALQQELTALVKKPLESKRLKRSYVAGAPISALAAEQLQQSLAESTASGVRAIGREAKDALAALTSKK